MRQVEIPAVVPPVVEQEAGVDQVEKALHQE